MSVTEVEEAKNQIQFVFMSIPGLKCKFFNQHVKTRSTCKSSKEQFQKDLEESVNSHSLFLSFEQEFEIILLSNGQEFDSKLINLQSKHIHFATVIIGQDIDDKEGVLDNLRRLKQSNAARKPFFGLMFACKGRGRDHYGGVTDVESSCWQNIFPKIPLFGVFGDGEFGLDKFLQDDEKLVKTFSALEKSYTTVFVVVGKH
ncbi:DgyrCDS13494 [Dimorphilus gyrociliatus]|uniref:DgyrCDS13494 n=1 Tax=Dimorphilus gyrociliatus TaxID=2664684 RepID=A0A7I8WAV1_9ANNE|nr:DgyrCDS13494 [Dimorphilus gyrociliatus]